MVNSMLGDCGESCQLIGILWSSLRKEEDKPLSLSRATRTTRSSPGKLIISMKCHTMSRRYFEFPDLVVRNQTSSHLKQFWSTYPLKCE